MSAKNDFQTAASYAGTANANARRCSQSASTPEIKMLAESVANLSWAVRQIAEGLKKSQ